MSGASGCGGSAIRRKDNRAADCLGFAAAPVFALMALATGLSGGGTSEIICSATPDAWPFGGMVLMYGLMSAFHAAPWLKLVSGGRSSAGRP